METLVDGLGQLQLDLPTALGALDRRPSIWLISASSEDATALRRWLSSGESSPSKSFLFVDLDTGAPAVFPDDLILLKTEDRELAELIAPVGLLRAIGSREIIDRTAEIFSSEPCISHEKRSLSLGLLRFFGNRKRNRRRGWSRSAIEETLDSLHCRKILENPLLASRICADFLDDPDLALNSPLRAVVQRVQADALAMGTPLSADWRSALAIYEDVSRAFLQTGAVRQSVMSDRRRMQLATAYSGPQLELFNNMPPRHIDRSPSSGFHVRRFTGMRLSVAGSWVTGRHEPGLLRHVHVASFPLPNDLMIRWLAGLESDSRMVSMLPVTDRPAGITNDRHLVEFVVDTELSTRSGFAGTSPHPALDDGDYFDLAPASETCRVEPAAVRTTLGRPARFTVLGGSRRSHQINLFVLTPNAAPTNISFRYKIPNNRI
ncbi:hypothetical protein [Mesorhizobium sp. ES1-6]|uniref:hypothetical protein n=1 Tax=Mesorhizobium sp. ES1-6 TaxID=2876626 RepID=UPI001CC99867|nr:hypothetical protein [Mesorhizobium sp. ES1-6]MBZ9801092.1 hypothetical protein [Mesorhizobium sp. ES1-6]